MVYVLTDQLSDCFTNYISPCMCPVAVILGCGYTWSSLPGPHQEQKALKKNVLLVTDQLTQFNQLSD